jgi:hypothetical protein
VDENQVGIFRLIVGGGLRRQCWKRSET